MFSRPIALLILPLFSACSLCQMPPEQTREIIRRSAQATQADWDRAPGFDFCEVDKTKTGSRTSAVLMIEGSPYYRVVQANSVDLPPAQEAAEQKRLASTIQRRQHETPDEKARRTAQYQKERHGDRELLEQLTEAMNFTFAGQEVVDSHLVDVFEAVPRAGYVPKSMQMQVLPGMKGKLWIDHTSFRWVKVQAEVVKPVSIAGFLARVEPGTRFELQERPINPSIWLAHVFTMQSRAKILFLISKSSEANETYFNYEPNGTLSINTCKSSGSNRPISSNVSSVTAREK
jgi:hypothetical protein